MKHTLSKREAENLLFGDNLAKWSREAVFALVDYYQDLEDELGEEIEFDQTAIRCEWTEFSSLEEVIRAYDFDTSESDDVEKFVMEWINDSGSVIIKLDIINDGECRIGYLVKNF
jgi:hypothetical protein